MRKIMIIGLLILLATGVFALTQLEVNNLDFTEENLSAQYLKDTKGDEVISVSGQRCVSYINVTTLVEIINSIIRDGMIVEEVLGYERKNVTREVWYPCYYHDNFTKEQIQEVLGYKKDDVVMKELGKVENFKVKPDYNLVSVDL